MRAGTTDHKRTPHKAAGKRQLCDSVPRQLIAAAQQGMFSGLPQISSVKRKPTDKRYIMESTVRDLVFSGDASSALGMTHGCGTGM